MTEEEKISKKAAVACISIIILSVLSVAFLEPYGPMEPITEEQISLKPLPLAPALIGIGCGILSIIILASMPWGVKA